MPKLQSVIILLNLFLVTGLKQKFNTEKECTKFDHISDKSCVVEETDHRHERNGIDAGKEIDSKKVLRNDESEALRISSPVLHFVKKLTDRINRIYDKLNIDHFQHSKQYQKINHHSLNYSHKYNYNYWNNGNPNEVNRIVNVTGVKNGDVKHGKVMEWNRFDPDIMKHPGEYKILDHNGKETGNVKVNYTVNGMPWDPNTGDQGSLLPEVKLGLDDGPGIHINSKGENREKMKYEYIPFWPVENREIKFKYLPTYSVEELKNREKERLAKKHSKKLYNRETIVNKVHNKNGSYSISKHLEYSNDWSNGNRNEINGVKIVNVTGVKNGDIKFGKILESNGFDPLIINHPGEYKILDQNGRETGNVKINYTVNGVPWDHNKNFLPKVTLNADINNNGEKRGYSKTKYTHRYIHKGYSSKFSQNMYIRFSTPKLRTRCIN